MSFFEYKVVPAPTVGRRRQRRVDGLDKYASTVADMMTELGLEGWDFVGAELLRERRRRFLILICDVERTLMIFRRVAAPLATDTAAAAHRNAPRTKDDPMPAAPVTPRRVKRPDLVEAVAAGARRIPVTLVERAPSAAATERPEQRATPTSGQPDRGGDQGDGVAAE
jgi:hypothetical protein